MAQAMMDFFDEKYFSEDCVCDLSKTSSRWSENCKLHMKKTAIKTEKEDILSANMSSVIKKVEINQSFPRQPTADFLIDAIEYRIKVLALNDIVLLPAESKKIQSNIFISRKAGSLSLLMKPCEDLPLRLQTEGFINPMFRGTVLVDLHNSTSNDVYLSAGSLICYLIMSPFIR